MKIAVIGSGGWGIAAAKLLCENGNDVVLWSFLEEEAALLKKERGNEKLLKGVLLPESIEITTDLQCAQGKDIVVMVTQLCEDTKKQINKKPTPLNCTL